MSDQVVGARGFEPPTSWSQTTRSTKLSYAPHVARSLPRTIPSRIRKSGYIVNARMKSFRALTAIVALGATVVVTGQVMTDSGLQPKAIPTSPTESIATPTPLPTIPDVSQLDQVFKQTSLGKEADERRLHIEWRELANRVANDPTVMAAKKSADSASTDLEKRQRLRSYYEIYYGRMRAMASSDEMRKSIDDLKLAHLSQTSQPRVRSETDSSLPTPSPTPKKKDHKGKAQKYGADQG
jgi:hypothetical protein